MGMNTTMNRSGIPTRDRGREWKVQYYEEHTMAWKDIQQRWKGQAHAVLSAEQYTRKTGRKTRLMEIDNNTGTRTPLTVITDGAGTRVEDWKQAV